MVVVLVVVVVAAAVIVVLSAPLESKLGFFFITAFFSRHLKLYVYE